MEVLEIVAVIVVAIIVIACGVALPCLFFVIARDLYNGSWDESVLWFLAVVTGSLTILEFTAIGVGLFKLLGVS